ncbi:MAG: sulfatase-like hydrolase/transferase [Phycisphaerae bacterium]|nr:sulfatase-like hydrolase/transferase [Phycisphaerae bacterium]
MGENINRRNFLKTTSLATIALAASGCNGILEKPKQKPNILFIFSDDHAYQAISAYGSKLNKTPNIDRIANEGMRFDQCFVTNSICAPQRAVVLTGKYNHLNGVIDNGANRRFDGSQQIFPKILGANGYNTAIIGKWHLSSRPEGFDYDEVLPGQGAYYNPAFIRQGEKIIHEGYVTDIIADISLDWLKNQRDQSKPFMLMMQNKAPHREWQPALRHLTLYDDVEMPEPDTLFDDYEGRGTAAKKQDMSIEKTMNAKDLKLKNGAQGLNAEQKKVWDAVYEPKNKKFEEANLQGKDLVRWKYQRYIKDYLRCIKAVDENVGRVLDYLDEAGLADNTLVIYSSDQGFYLGEHGWFDKRFMYKESFRTPFVARWPGVIKPGSVNADIVSLLDCAETFVDVAGQKIPDDMQGASLLPVMQGKTPKNWRKSIYYHYYEFPAVHSVNRHFGVRTKRYKLIFFYELNEWELYDMDKDPKEMENQYLNPEYASIINELKQELKRLQKQYKDENGQGHHTSGKVPKPGRVVTIPKW